MPLGGRYGGMFEFTKSMDEPSEGYNPKLLGGPDTQRFFQRCLSFGEPVSPQACWGARGFFELLLGVRDLSDKEMADRFEEMISWHKLFVNGTNEPPLMPFVERSKAADLDSLKYKPIDEILNEPKKKTIELELIYEDLEKTPVRDTPYRITFSNNQVVNGRLDERGQAILPNMPDLPATLEYGLYLDYSEKQFKKVLDELKDTYGQLEDAIDQTVKAIGAHMLAVAESKPEPPADMYEAATQLVEKELAQLEAENERYNNLSYLEQSFLNIRGAAGGVVEGVEEYIPDLGEFGDLLSATNIDISDVVMAITTGNVKAIREIQTKFQKWPDRGAKGFEQASLAMEVLILLLLDPKTRDLLASASVRMMKALPPHELIKITATQFTQFGIDTIVVSGGTAGGTMISGPGGAAVCVALLAAASMRKGGKILQGLVELLNKIAMRLKPLVANQYAYAGGVNTKNKSVLMYSEAAEKHEAKHRSGGASASKKDEEKNKKPCPRCGNPECPSKNISQTGKGQNKRNDNTLKAGIRKTIPGFPASHPWYDGDSSLEVHHLIPCEAVGKKVWKKLFDQFDYDINEEHNTVVLPSSTRLACELGVQRHKGKHSRGMALEEPYFSELRELEKAGDIKAISKFNKYLFKINDDYRYHKAAKKMIGSITRSVDRGTYCKTGKKALTKEQMKKKFEKEMKKKSVKILKLVDSFTWTIAWDSRDYKPGSPYGCSNTILMGQKYAYARGQRCEHGRDHQLGKGPFNGTLELGQ